MVGTLLFQLVGALATAGLVGATIDNSTIYGATSGVQHEYCVDGTLFGVVTSVRIAVGITCCLSMVGAVLIILAYILIKDVRTRSRRILVNISIMDFFVAAGNVTGTLINFDEYLRDGGSSLTPHKYTLIENACKAQASISMYCNTSSILWTNCLAVYIYVQSMLRGQYKVAWSMYVFYIISYGLPLIVTLWYILTGKLGYSPYGGSGWCAVILSDNETGVILPFNAVFANDLWIYLTIIVVPLTFISLKVSCLPSIQLN